MPLQRRDAYTFAVSDRGADRVRSELAVSRAAGLAVEEVTDPGLPFATRASIRLPDQAQFNPMDILESLAADFRAHGGVLVEGTRVLDVSRGSRVSVTTDGGNVYARRVVLATGIPVLDRGLYFAKLKASQSYAAAFRVPASTPVPSGMYLSAETPGRSLRTYPSDAGEMLIAGGNGHQVGREPSTRARLDELVDWTRRHFPGAEPTHTWSGEDYQATNLMPFFGKLPRGGGKILFATGYNKWGMSNSVAASLAITAEILGGNLPWAAAIHHRVTSPKGAAAAVALNADTVKTMAEGWAKAETAPPDTAAPPVPAEGEGRIVRHGRKPVAVSTVYGVTCRVSAVCTHLRGVLSWNDAEKTWDGPLHGSRFTPAGDVLQGPTTKTLPAAD